MAVILEFVCHQIGDGELERLKRATENFARKFAAVHMDVSVKRHCGIGGECDPGHEGVEPRVKIRITTVDRDTLGSFAAKLPTLLEYLGVSNLCGTISLICLLGPRTEGEPDSRELDDAETANAA